MYCIYCIQKGAVWSELILWSRRGAGDKPTSCNQGSQVQFPGLSIKKYFLWAFGCSRHIMNTYHKPSWPSSGYYPWKSHKSFFYCLLPWNYLVWTTLDICSRWKSRQHFQDKKRAGIRVKMLTMGHFCTKMIPCEGNLGYSKMMDKKIFTIWCSKFLLICI